MVKHRIAALCAAATAVSGCASILDGSDQLLAVDTRTGNGAVPGAHCTLSNDKGSWQVIAPGTARVQRSFRDLDVHCRKTGLAQAGTAIRSSARPVPIGYLVLGGLIGAGIDMASGAAFDYPSAITVEMAEPADSTRLSAQEIERLAAAGGALSALP